MFGRIIFAAILGGVFVFAAGAAEHMYLRWQDRTFKKPANLEAVKQSIKNDFGGAGIYSVPPMPDKNHFEMTEEERKAFVEVFKAGPNAQIIVRPSQADENNMFKMMGFEFAANVVCAFIIGIVLAMTRPSVGFIGRWFAVILLGVFAWGAVSASHFIWYGYPWDYIQDELLNTVVKWAVGGFIIAAIVKPHDVVMRY